MTVSFSWTLSIADTTALSSTATSATTSADTALRDLALASDDDILISEGDLVFNYGAAGIASDVRARLQTRLGECFLDTSMGVPWFEKILGHKPSAGELRNIFREEILATPGIDSLSSLDVSVTNRVLRLTFKAMTATGATLDAALGINLGGA
jgi:hypothetical protein